MTAADWEARLQALVGVEFGDVLACDDVNAAAIRHWREVFGLPPGGDVPLAMLGAWLAAGPSGARPPGSASQDATSVMALLGEGGYTGLIGAGTEIEMTRVPAVGERLVYRSALESIGEEKATSLGPGRFARLRFDVRATDVRAVGTLRFTQLAYRPHAQ